jgi:hypothetical protein
MAMGLPGFGQHKVIRAPVNPMDKSTVVSIFPKRVDEEKPTIQPGRFVIEPGSYDKPSILVVGTSSWWKELDPEQPHLEIPVSSIQIADSIVKDYCNGILGCNMGDKMPGLFFVPGEISVKEIKTDLKYKSLLDKAKEYQKNWYMELIQVGDILWSRTNGNPLAINGDMRLAAQELQLKDKPWLKDFSTLELTNCPACGTLRNSSFPVCGNCKTILDQKRFNELGLKMAV